MKKVFWSVLLLGILMIPFLSGCNGTGEEKNDVYTVTPAGRSIVVSSATIVFPAGSFDRDVEVRVESVNVKDAITGGVRISLLTGGVLLKKSYEIRFDAPGAVTDNVRVAALSPDSRWIVQKDVSVDSSGKVTVRVTGFTTYAPFPADTEGLFVPPYLSSVKLSSSYVKAGVETKIDFALSFVYDPQPEVSCRIYIGGKYGGDVTSAGSFTLSIDYPESVSFECKNEVGSDSITSLVRPAVAPRLKNFAVSPPIIPSNGAPISFVWSYENNPVPEPRCSVEGLGTGVVYGNIKSGFTTAANILNLTYRLTCENLGGSSSLIFSVIPWTQSNMGSFEVTPQGGTYSFQNSLLSLTIIVPPDEVTEPVTFTIKPSTDYYSSGSLFTLPIDIEPSYSFPNPITVKISYNPELLKSFGIDDPSMISLGLGTEGGWRTIYSEVDTATATITAYLNHFSQYSVVPGPQRRQPLKGNITMLYGDDKYVFFHPYNPWGDVYSGIRNSIYVGDYDALISYGPDYPCSAFSNRSIDGVVGDFDGDGYKDFAVLCLDKDESGMDGDVYYLEVYTSWWGPLKDHIKVIGGGYYVKLKFDSTPPYHPFTGDPTQFRGAILKTIHLSGKNRDAIVVGFVRRFGVDKEEYELLDQQLVGAGCKSPDGKILDTSQNNELCDYFLNQADDDRRMKGAYAGLFLFGVEDDELVNLMGAGNYYRINDIKAGFTMDVGDANDDGSDEIIVAGLNGSTGGLMVFKPDELGGTITRIASYVPSSSFLPGASTMANMFGVGVGDFDEDGNIEIGLTSIVFGIGRNMELLTLKDNVLSLKKSYSFIGNDIFEKKADPDSFVNRSLVGDVNKDYVDDMVFGTNEKIIVTTFYRQRVAGELEEAKADDIFEYDLRKTFSNDTFENYYKMNEDQGKNVPDEGAYFTLARKGGTSTIVVGGLKTFYHRIEIPAEENPCGDSSFDTRSVGVYMNLAERRVYFPGDKLEQQANGEILTNKVSEWDGSSVFPLGPRYQEITEKYYDKDCNFLSRDIDSISDSQQPIVLAGDFEKKASIIEYAGDYYHSESPPLPVIVMAPPPTYRVLTRNRSSGGEQLQSNGYSQYGQGVYTGDASSKTVGTKTGLTVSSDYDKSFKILSFGFGWSDTIEKELSSTVQDKKYILYGTERQGGSDDFTIVYAVQKFVSFKYWVVQHTDPQFNPRCDENGNCEYEHVYIDVPDGDPLVYTKSLEDYPGDKDAIRSVFKEKPGFPETYMTREEADALVDVDAPDGGDSGKYLGFESYEQTLGTGSGGYQSVYITVGNESSYEVKEKISNDSSWYIFFTGYSKHTYTEGVFTEKAYDVFQGVDVTYKGILGNVISGCFGSDKMPDPNGPCAGLDAYDYRWGMVVYNYTPVSGQGFFVIDYYVDAAPFIDWYYYDSGANVDVGYLGEEYNKWVNEGTSGNVLWGVDACDYLNGDPANCGDEKAAGVIDLSFQFVTPFGGDHTYFVKRIAPDGYTFDSESANTLQIKYRVVGSSDEIGKIVVGLVPYGNSYSDFIPLETLENGTLRDEANVPTTDTGWKEKSYDLSQSGLNIGPFDRIVFYLDSRDEDGNIHTGSYHLYIDYIRLYDRNFPQ